jgi:hypothetical protein
MGYNLHDVFKKFNLLQKEKKFAINWNSYHL